MSNYTALKIQRAIERIINKIAQAKTKGNLTHLAAYRDILNKRIQQWEIEKGDTVNNNPIMYNHIVNLLKG